MRSQQSASDVGSSNQFVTFSAGGTGYGIYIVAVREIRSWTPTTELPSRDSSAKGMLDIRGKVVEVFAFQPPSVVRQAPNNPSR